jgi:hypothetical protein
LKPEFLIMTRSPFSRSCRKFAVWLLSNIEGYIISRIILVLVILAVSCCKNTPPPVVSVTETGDTAPGVITADEAAPSQAADGAGTGEIAGADDWIDDDGEEIDLPDITGALPENSFGEVWAYLAKSREQDLKIGYPISDIVYFATEINRYGNLEDVPRRRNVSAKFKGRVHLALVCDSSGLTHFVIQPGSEARRQLVSEIISAARDYDGLNVDIENVPSRDAENFLSFLRELRAELGDKILSVCVPGRTRAGGTYNYAPIAAIADRIFVMAYDEHWANSKPGPVASMNWCRAVADFGLKSVGPEKLVMGIPFYGRGWGDKSTSRALIYSTTEWHKQQYGADDFRRVNGIPTFTYDVNVKVTVYYEDVYSLTARMRMYRNQGVQNIGFWRLGQEPVRVWRYIKLD